MRYGPGLVWMLAAALLLLAASARADDIVAVYAAYWAGLPAGEIQIRLHDGAAAYHDEIEIRTTGLPALITRLRGTGIAVLLATPIILSNAVVVKALSQLPGG